jgi:protein-S-isoprenylcysteine O-methyltransferase Ste14
MARKGINPITLNLRGKGWLGIVEVLLFVQVNLWVLAVLLYALPLDALPHLGLLGRVLVDAPAARFAGVILIGIAFALFGLAMAALGDAWRLGLDEPGPDRLVTGGVYAVSRNPIYLFFDLYFVGTFLVNGSLLFLLLAVLAAANLHVQILHEEAFLGRLHGPAYEAYRGRTARYLGQRRAAPRVQRVPPIAGPRRRAPKASSSEDHL